MEGGRAKFMMTDLELTLSGEPIIYYVGNALLNCAPGNYVVRAVKVTHICFTTTKKNILHILTKCHSWLSLESV